MCIQGESFLVETDRRVEILDLTERIGALVRRAGVDEGLVHLAPLHTTCALFINEYQTALSRDMERFVAQLVTRDAEWLHNDPAHSDCDRMNADAHLRAMLVGHTLTLQISGAEIVLGEWQRILFAEFDGPRARTLRAQVWGVVADGSPRR